MNTITVEIKKEKKLYQHTYVMIKKNKNMWASLQKGFMIPTINVWCE